MEDLKTIFNFFDSVIDGMHRPHLHDDDLIPAEKRSQIAFWGLIDEDEKIQFDGLSDLFHEGDKIKIELTENQPYDESVHVIISELDEDWKELLIDLDITPTFNEKSEFYYDYLLTAYTVTCSRIEKQLSALTTAKFKQSFSDSLVLYVRNLLDHLDEYEHTLKHNADNDNDRANNWTIKTARIYLLRLLAFICQKFDGFCSFKIKTQQQWEDELYPEKAAQLKKTISLIEKKFNARKKIKSAKKIHPAKFAGYGFTGDPVRLLTLLNALQLRMRKKLINETKCTIENLHLIFISNPPSGAVTPVHFSCETTQLAYLLRKLKPFFTNFEDDLIESSMLFYTSKGRNLSAQNIRKSFSETPEPKDFEVIDQLIAELARS